jgi:hypothetical protein
MPRTSTVPLTAAFLLAAGLLGACGQDEPATPPGSSTSTTAGSFPVTITRTGGVAGFRDSVRVQADGEVVATTTQGEVRCTLDRAALESLRQGASAIGPTDSPTPLPSGTADQLEVLIATGTGTARVDDPRVAPAVPVVDQLLADVTGPAASRTICS